MKEAHPGVARLSGCGTGRDKTHRIYEVEVHIRKRKKSTATGKKGNEQKEQGVEKNVGARMACLSPENKKSGKTGNALQNPYIQEPKGWRGWGVF